MKKIGYLFVYLISTLVFAQNDSSNTDRNILTAILNQINGLRIEEKLYGVRNSDSKSGRFVTEFRLSRYAVRPEEDLELVVLPFDIRITTDQRVFLDFSLFNIRSDYKRYGELSFKTLTIEYKKDYDYSNSKELAFYLFSPEYKKNFILNRSTKLKTKVRANFLSIYAINSFIVDETLFKTQDPNLQDMTNSLFTSAIYEKSLNKNSVLNFGLESRFRHTSFNSVSTKAGMARDAERQEYRDSWNEQRAQYFQAKDNWVDEKFQWEVDNGHANPVSQAHYIALSGNDLPVYSQYVTLEEPASYNSGEFMKRTRFVITPRLEFRRKLNRSKTVHELGISFSANFIVTDKIKGDLSEFDLKNDLSLERNLYNLGLVLSF